MRATTLYKVCQECGENIRIAHAECPFCGCKSQDGEERHKCTEFEWPEELAIDAEHNESKKLENEKKRLVANEEKKQMLDVAFSQNSHIKPISEISKVKELTNAKKVAMITICNFFLLIGPLIGVIISLIQMSSSDNDRKAFGKAFLTTSVIMFVFGLLTVVSLVALFMNAM